MAALRGLARVLLNGVLIVAGLLLVLGVGLALATRIGAARIEAAHPPAGRIVAVEGGPVHVLDRGPRSPFAVVLIHGASGNLNDIDESLGQALALHHRVVMIDRPGHGYSARPGGAAQAAPDAQARTIAAALDAIGVERALVVGHSLGAAVAMAQALEDAARTVGLILVAPATHPWGRGGVSWHNYVAARDDIGPLFAATFPLPLGLAVMETVVKAVFAPEPVPQNYIGRIGARLVLRPGNFRANAQDVVALLGNVTRLSPRYREIGVPALVIEGRDDPIVYNHIHADGLMRDLPDARRVTLPAGHMPHWTHSAAVRSDISAMARALSTVSDPVPHR